MKLRNQKPDTSNLDSDPSSFGGRMINRVRNPLLRVAAIGVLGVTALTGCSSADSGPVDRTPETSTSASPSTPSVETPVPVESQPKTPAELVNAKEFPTNILELGTYKLLSPENQEIMQSLNAMDKVTFRAQPYEAQVGFCMQILNNLRPIVDYGMELNNLNDIHYTDNATTAQELENNNEYLSIATTRLITAGDGEYIFDTELAYKMASCGQDTRITEEGLWDQIYGQATGDTAWSYESMDKEFRVTVTGESTSPDGTLTSDIVDLQGGTATKQYKQITYTDMFDGTPKSMFVLTDALQTS